MKGSGVGQSSVETSILTASIAIGILSLWAVCGEKIVNYIELTLAIISSPIP